MFGLKMLTPNVVPRRGLILFCLRTLINHNTESERTGKSMRTGLYTSGEGVGDKAKYEVEG